MIAVAHAIAEDAGEPSAGAIRAAADADHAAAAGKQFSCLSQTAFVPTFLPRLSCVQSAAA